MAINFSSDIALKGQLNYNFPGDWAALAYRRTNSSKGYTKAGIAGIDGFKGWRYGTFPLNTGAITWCNENNATTDAFGGTHLFRNTNGDYPFFNLRGEVHPSNGILNVIRWRPPYNGTIRMTGHITDANAGGGDGVNVWVATMKGVDVSYINNIETYHVPVTKVKNSYLTFDTTINVSTSKALYMIVGADTEEGYDTTDCGWNIRYTSIPSGFSGSSLRDNLADNTRHTYIMPNFADGQKDDGDDIENSGSGVAKFSYFNNAFIPPLVVRTALTSDTSTGASSGNGTITCKVIDYPTTDSTVWFRMTAHYSNVGLADHYDVTNKYPGMYASNSNGEYTFSGLTGGIYGFGTVISAPSLGITELDVSQTHLMANLTFVERGLVGYVS